MLFSEVDLVKTLSDPELKKSVKACQIDPALLILGKELGEGKSFIISSKLKEILKY